MPLIGLSEGPRRSFDPYKYATVIKTAMLEAWLPSELPVWDSDRAISNSELGFVLRGTFGPGSSEILTQVDDAGSIKWFL